MAPWSISEGGGEQREEAAVIRLALGRRGAARQQRRQDGWLGFEEGGASRERIRRQ